MWVSLAYLLVLVASLVPRWGNNTVIMKAITARTAGTGGGLVNMARGLGIAIGVALVGLEPQR